MVRFIFFIFLCVSIASCGLTYTPIESPAAFEQRRHDSIESYLTRTFNTSGIRYKSIAFAAPQTIKPLSYQKLDSLFDQKYSNEKKGISDKRLDNLIENQRIISLNDTNKVIYIENHIFALVKGDTFEIYDGNFRLSNDLKIDDVHLNESVYLPKKYEEMYKVYLFEEAFITVGHPPTEGEKEFYGYYKSASRNLTGSKRDAFILHTLNLMDYATKNRTLDIETLLRYSALKNLHGNSYVNHLDKFSAIEQLVQINDKKEEILIGYKLNCSYVEMNENNVQVTRNYSLIFDEFLQLTEKKLLN
jgi:hypothetical protein